MNLLPTTRRGLNVAEWRAALLWIMGALVVGRMSADPHAAVPQANPSAVVAPKGGPADVIVTIPPALLARGGMETAPATLGNATSGLRIPAIVQPHAYHQAVVTSAADGRVLSVAVEPGRRVVPGDALAEINSPEVAETERAFISVQADLALVQQQITRLDRLVAIGAASRQELDVVRARQTQLAADLEGVRARLTLVGRSAGRIAALVGPQAISATVTIVAPIAGTVISRTTNPGQTIEAATALFTIVDLDTVWAIGDVYERDLAGVHVGDAVTVTGAAFPGQSFASRVTYLDPQLAPETRTARIRVELPNPAGRFRLGMLMEMRVDAPGHQGVVIPRSALQTIDGVTVVYVADPVRAGTFIERSVRVADGSGDQAEVLAGLKAGESVVSSGSFLVRSERDRSNVTPPRPVAGLPRPTPAVEHQTPDVIDIAVTEDGFSPVETHIKANTPIRVRFTRKVEATCVTEVVFASLKIRRPLPVGQTVVIDLPPQPSGRLDFACGMNMVRGRLIVDSRPDIGRSGGVITR